VPDELSAEQMYLFRFSEISRMVNRTHTLGVICNTGRPRHLIVPQRDAPAASAVDRSPADTYTTRPRFQKMTTRPAADRMQMQRLLERDQDEIDGRVTGVAHFMPLAKVDGVYPAH
jgi:hypothetical protein